MEDQFRNAMTSREAAHYIGMSESWLRQMRMHTDARIDGPPYMKIGRAVRYLRSDLDHWLADQKRYFS